MKKVMIVGASVGQISLIKKAKELGYFVAVSDYNSEAIGIPYADKFYNVSTIDEEAIINASKDFETDGITTVQTDMPMRAIGRVNETFHLNGLNYETALKATDKVRMIQCFKEKKVPCPWFYIVENENELNELKDRLKFPCIYKPADNSASRGVVLVKSIEEMFSAYYYARQYSKSGVVLVEEYMKGPEVSVEIIVTNGIPHTIMVTDKLTTGAPYFVEMGHSQPSSIEAIQLDQIKKVAEQAILAVGVENGEGHVEVILTQTGPKIVELGARLGGDFITSDLVPLSTGVDMLATTIQIACGDDICIEPRFNKGSAIRFINGDVGKIKSIQGIEEAYKIPGVHRIELFKNVGENIDVVKNSLDRVGCVIAQGINATDAITICEKALKMIKIEVE